MITIPAKSCISILASGIASFINFQSLAQIHCHISFPYNSLTNTYRIDNSSIGKLISSLKLKILSSNIKLS